MSGILEKSTAVHTSPELSIFKMVLNRLPIIADTPENRTLISNFILEIMVQLNKCLKKEDSQVGIESNYTLIEQSIIADLTSLNILMVAAIESTGGNATSGAEAVNTFLKKAKAGSVEVEFGPFSLKDNPTLATGLDSMYKFFKNNAINKAGQIGCMIDITDDFSIKFLMDDTIIKPFIIVGDCGCGGSGETIIERM